MIPWQSLSEALKKVRERNEIKSETSIYEFRNDGRTTTMRMEHEGNALHFETVDFTGRILRSNARERQYVGKSKLPGQGLFSYDEG